MTLLAPRPEECEVTQVAVSRLGGGRGPLGLTVLGEEVWQGQSMGTLVCAEE